jgi:hypothetical protein
MSVSAAIERAVRLRGGAALHPRPVVAPLRAVAIGDPQTSTDRWFGALAAHGLLADDGWLRPDVRLTAMGDYFDYHVPERERAREEARKRAEEESRKPVAERSRMPEFGSDKDFQLEQAIKRLKGQPVIASKTQTERAAEKKDQ